MGLAVLFNRDVYPGSRILIFIHPGSQISDPGSNNSTKRGGDNFFCPTIFVAKNAIKLQINFIFEQVKKIFLAKTLRIILLFTQKFVIKLSKIWVWDPGSEIWKKPIPDPGSRVKKAPDPGPGSLTLGLNKGYP
jgi:hypothetical protein